ncbi:hypothetical protein [Cyanobium sp. ATX 6F1]|uniref:hypothetical protein n=1 Tax=unclassified Cyanobium TaxID=2627006 RepID=UPI0020CF7B92|nr:hypothetical protein [Cyanobium sp. ATX 6F1]MCP9915244.1 hypothetical protein [Cyanobium sp. ATX 6F1]
MPTTLAFKDILDLPKWRPLAPAPAASAAGSSLAFDMRGGGKAHPLHYLLSNATTFSAYSPQNDEWIGLSSPALAGAFGAGASSIVHPTRGPAAASRLAIPPPLWCSPRRFLPPWPSTSSPTVVMGWVSPCG